MNFMKYSVLALALSLSVSAKAHAHGDDRHHPPPPPPPPSKCGGDRVAPEVDPSLAMGGLTLLGGTLTVLRARRRS